mmetsp:Transcript_13002/g.33180  ORF Transcript_13002/g.33180 Transcript_13002/m.33180 type:complete len:98 (-) Transcript_13002:29-322(-)
MMGGPPPPPPPHSGSSGGGGGGGASLLDGLAQAKLKKVDTTAAHPSQMDLPDIAQLTGEQGAVLADTLAKAMMQRRGHLHVDEAAEDSDEEASDWSD